MIFYRIFNFAHLAATGGELLPQPPSLHEASGGLHRRQDGLQLHQEVPCRSTAGVHHVRQGAGPRPAYDIP